MSKLAILLPAILIAAPGCVVTYGNFPDVRADALLKHHVSESVSYLVDKIPTSFADDRYTFTTMDMYMVMFVTPNYYPLMMKDWRDAGREVIGKTLAASGMFSEALAVAEPPEAEDDTIPHKGLQIDVGFGIDPPSKWAEWLAVGQGVPVLLAQGFPPAIVLFPLAFDLIPYYSGEGGLRVKYRLYREGTLHAVYEYTIKKKGWGGLFLLPIAWLNFFTDDLKDGLRATTLQFLIDAHRDGNL
jgi:hypothetical protein